MTTLSEDDPFQDVDSQCDLERLISSTMGTSGQCSVEVYINGDNDIAVCAEFDGDTWDETFLEGLAGHNETAITEEDSDTEDLDLLPPPPKIRSCQEAIKSLEDVKNFLESRNCFTEATATCTLIDQVAKVHSVTARQSTLDDFFDVQNVHS